MKSCRRFHAFATIAIGLISAAANSQDGPNNAVVPATRGESWMRRHESFNERAKQGNVDLVFADNQMIFFLDIGPKFLAADGTLSREVMPDLLHLNAASYRTWADAIEPQVKELMGESR